MHCFEALTMLNDDEQVYRHKWCKEIDYFFMFCISVDGFYEDLTEGYTASFAANEKKQMQQT